MRIAIEAGDVGVPNDILEAVGAASERVGRSPSFAGARDLRLRLRQTKNALLCIAAVGFASGSLVTSTAEGKSPYEAIVGALDELPARMERLDGARRSTEEGSPPASPETQHAAVRAELRRLLDGRG